MSETEEPPVKVLKIDSFILQNFDQELAIPGIDMGNGAAIPGMDVENGTAIPDAMDNSAEETAGCEETPEDASTDNIENIELNNDKAPDLDTDNAADNQSTDAEPTDVTQDDQFGDDTDISNQEDALKNQIEALDRDFSEADGNDQLLDDHYKTDQIDGVSQPLESLDKDLEETDQVTDKSQCSEENDQLTDDPNQLKDGDNQEMDDQPADAMEGQEEWLSEGILTDDDLTSATNAESNQHTTETKILEQNIEETLNNLEGGHDRNITNSGKTAAVKEEQDDGNDTDDLLRMLGEDDTKPQKKLTKTVKDIRKSMKSAHSSDEEYEFDEKSLKTLKLTKSAITKKVPPKAEPEDTGDEDSDQSSDEASFFNKMLNTKKPDFLSKKLSQSQSLVVVKKEGNKKPPVQIVSRRVIHAADKALQKRPGRTNVTNRSTIKAYPPAKVSKHNPDRLEYKSSVGNKSSVKSNSVLKNIGIKKVLEDECLDTEDQMNEELIQRSRQRIVCPEEMDEDVFSEDSFSEEGSLFNELPSSESEDMEDWFEIDIRAERAPDYLPYLGANARELLLEEKERAAAKVANLRQSLSALTESGKKQAEELRNATLTLTEIDDMIKSS